MTEMSSSVNETIYELVAVGNSEEVGIAHPGDAQPDDSDPAPLVVPSMEDAVPSQQGSEEGGCRNSNGDEEDGGDEMYELFETRQQEPYGRNM